MQNDPKCGRVLILYRSHMAERVNGLPTSILRYTMYNAEFFNLVGNVDTCFTQINSTHIRFPTMEAKIKTTSGFFIKKKYVTFFSQKSKGLMLSTHHKYIVFRHDDTKRLPTYNLSTVHT